MSAAPVPGEVLGEGLTAWVVARSETEVLKVFKPDFAREAIEYEARILAALSNSEVDLPRLVEVLEIDGRPALVLERARGFALVRSLFTSPWAAVRWIRRFARHQAALHRVRVPGLPTQTERFMDMIRRSGLNDAQIENFSAELAKLPSAQTCCHGDFHPENLLRDGERLVTLDWMNAYSGHPLGDVVRTHLMLKTPYARLGKPWFLKQIIGLYQALVAGTYRRTMVRLCGFRRADFKRWLPVVCAARLSDQVPGEREWLLRMLSRARKI